MLLRIIKTIIRWVKEVWELLKVISEVTPQPNQNNCNNPNNSKIITNRRQNALHDWRSSGSRQDVVRHRYIEVDGYADNFRIDRLGRYDLLQIERFCEHFEFVSEDAIDDFVDDSINYAYGNVDGCKVMWLPKDDCIEFAYHHCSALADVL